MKIRTFLWATWSTSRWRLLALLLTLLIVNPVHAERRVQLGPNGPAIVDTDQPEQQQSQEAETVWDMRQNRRRVSRITVRAASEPKPALRYSLTVNARERQPGNAAPYYYRAILRLRSVDQESLQSLSTLVEQFSLPTAQAILPRFDSAFDELRVAVRREYCRWDWRIRDRSGEEQTEFLLEEVQEVRRLADAISVKVAVQIASGDLDGAIETLAIGYQLARDISQPPILVNDLVGISIATEMNRRVAQLIDAKGSPNLYWALASLPRPLVDTRASLQHERALPYAFFPFLDDPENVQLSEEGWRRAFDQVRVFLNLIDQGKDDGEPLAAAAVVTAVYPRAKAELIGAGFDQAEIDAMPVGKVVAIHESRVLTRVSDDLFKWSLLPYHEAEHSMAERDEIQPFDPMAENGESLPIGSSLFPSVVSALRAEIQLQCELDGLRAIEAIRLHMAANDGELPAVLEDVKVVPVPLNPSRNKPFIYRPMSDGQGRFLEVIPGKDPSPQSIWNFELRR